MLGNVAIDAIRSKAKEFEKAALDIWAHPELGFNEVHANKVVCDLARELGFKVTSPAYGMPTCMEARWGDGGPVIGFLGELDALPGLSQVVSTKQQEAEHGAPGQGCGHNLLAIAPLAAAYGAMMELKASGKKGTVVYYGCPAEEKLTGKPFMAREGAFKDLDAAFSWHGGVRNNAGGWGKNTGVDSMVFHFHGRTAHAGGDPHNGRSALDAVELTDVGANYLREHVTSDVRIHYTITEGGTAPNIVPDRAAVLYFVRAMSMEAVNDTYERLCEVARGAARMTGTTVEIEHLGGCYDTMQNQVLAQLADECMREIGVPEYTAEELDFAREINKQSPNYKPEVHDKMPIENIVEPINDGMSFGSTDVGDVQHIVPCLLVITATAAYASPGHSWMITSCAGHSIGIKGMLYGAETLAMATMKLVEDPKLLEAAKKEFTENMGGKTYRCPVPAEAKVPQPEK